MSKATDYKLIQTNFMAMPRVIAAPGKYRTRCGEIVEVFHIAQKRSPYGWHYAWGEYPDETKTKEGWEVSGRILPHTETDNDIIEKVPAIAA